MQKQLRAVLLVGLLAAFTTLATLARAAQCSESEITQAAVEVDLARKALITLPIGNRKFYSPRVSPEAQQAIETMKTRLGDFIAAYMRCATKDRDAAAIERDLSERAHALLEDQYRNRDKLPEDFEHYGFELDFAVQRWTDHPSLVGIVANFQIECGSDAMLFLFSAESGQWVERLRWQSKHYDTIAGGFGDFDYRISPSDEAGNWYVLVKSLSPDCSSPWSDIHYAIIRLGADPSKPRIIYQNWTDLIFWAYEDFGQLSADKSEFEIRFHSQDIDLDMPKRVWIRRFSITDDHVERIPPVALSPRDFVDEWLLTWSEAASWVEADVRSRAMAIHDRIFAEADDGLSYGDVTRCADRDDHYQVGVIVHRNDSKDPRHFYFFSVVGRTDYRLTNVTTTPDPACDGPDILDTMDTP